MTLDQQIEQVNKKLSDNKDHLIASADNMNQDLLECLVDNVTLYGELLKSLSRLKQFKQLYGDTKDNSSDTNSN